MDFIDDCKKKVAQFRIKELKDVLTQIGLSKQGKKQDLVARILAILSNEEVPKLPTRRSTVGKEEVAKLVDDTYRKMQVSGATDLASMEQDVLNGSNVKIKTEVDDPIHSDTKVRCPCGSSLDSESMIKCEDPRCHVWQHIGCVIIPENAADGIPKVPDFFYCEICRLSRADPFLLAMAHPLYPVMLTACALQSENSNLVQTVERSFNLTRADKDLFAKQEYDLQVWCMLLNDRVPFRVQWPQYADLQANGIPVRVVNRPGSQLLGANGRDDGLVITHCTKDGINKISLTMCDARVFCFGVRIVKRRTVQQILRLVQKESDGEPLDDALARVRRCVGGGAVADDADSDSDLEVVADSFALNLRCPMSGSRMKVAGRFRPCAHMGCFDLQVFVEMNQRTRKWQCPICLKNYSLENMIVDPYFNRIASKMKNCGQDITEIEIRANGCWRVKARSDADLLDAGELLQWQNPDGSSSFPSAEPNMELPQKIKQEWTPEGCAGSGSGLKLGIRKNQNGFWEVSRPDDPNLLASPRDNFRAERKVIHMMSSTATGSGRDGEDPSVNQDGGVNYEFVSSGFELDSLSLNADSMNGFDEQTFSKPIGEADVIVLSDSDDENEDDEVMISSGTVCAKNITDGAQLLEIDDPYSVPAIGNGGSSSLDVFNDPDEEYGIPMWPMPPLPLVPQPGPELQFLHSSIPPARGVDAASRAVQPVTDLIDSLADNPFAYGSADPSLQIFLSPMPPSPEPVPANLRDEAATENGVHGDDWISLRLGGDAAGSTSVDKLAAASNGWNSFSHIPSRTSATNPSAIVASRQVGTQKVRSEKPLPGPQRTDSPFCFPRQKRSAKLGCSSSVMTSAASICILPTTEASYEKPISHS